MTNLSLNRLREETEAFITETDFQVIELEYLDYLRSNNLKDNTRNAEEFYNIWAKEQEMFDTLKTTSDGKLKYYMMDADDTPMTMEDYLNNLDMTSYHWENLCRSYWNIFENIFNTGNIDKELIKNILSERTISHEQIYELQSTIKDRIVELVTQQ